MPGARPVTLLRPVLEDPHLGAALVSGDLGLDLDLLEVLAEDHLLVAKRDGEIDLLTLLGGERSTSRVEPFSTRYCLPPVSITA